MKKQSAVLGIIQNITALALLPVYYVIFVSARKSIAPHARENCAVFFTDGIPVETIPECLSKEYREIILSTLTEEMCMGKEEKKVLCALINKFWYSPYFLFKCMLKIGMYAAKIEQYNPKAIISYSEYSYTSSVLTAYCRLRGVEHINIMHGEKLFNIRDTFVKYDRYYVWDEYYIKLLTDLRADKAQFRIAVPPSVKLDCKPSAEPIYEYTYYLAGENTEELLTIRNALLSTGVPVSRICIRYHPRYCDAEEIKRIYAGFHIENPAKVPLVISISRTKYVVSLFSTVLYQAYSSGREIVIDDVTDKSKYEKLKQLCYIMFDKPHGKLSEHLANGEVRKK